jgi:uncharacterized protein (DUF302 family)
MTDLRKIINTVKYKSGKVKLHLSVHIYQLHPLRVLVWDSYSCTIRSSIQEVQWIHLAKDKDP